MKTILATLAILLAALQLIASPLDDFRVAMLKVHDNELPPFWVTWDEDAKENRELYDKDWKAYYQRMASKAKEHERLLRRLTGVADISLNEYGRRVDRVEVQTFRMSAAELLRHAADDRAPGWASMKRLTKLDGLDAMDAAVIAFGDLNNQVANLDAGKHMAFLSRYAKAYDGFDALLKGEASIDQLRALVAFLDAYCK